MPVHCMSGLVFMQVHVPKTFSWGVGVSHRMILCTQFVSQNIFLCIRCVSQGLCFPQLYTRHQNFRVPKVSPPEARPPPYYMPEKHPLTAKEGHHSTFAPRCSPSYSITRQSGRRTIAHSKSSPWTFPSPSSCTICSAAAAYSVTRSRDRPSGGDPGCCLSRKHACAAQAPDSGPQAGPAKPEPRLGGYGGGGVRFGLQIPGTGTPVLSQLGGGGA